MMLHVKQVDRISWKAWRCSIHRSHGLRHCH